MSDWISIDDLTPEPKQPITARVLYMGKIQEVRGCRDEKREVCVLYDFYSGTGYSEIIEWKPRNLPNKDDAHPWTGIENHGL